VRVGLAAARPAMSEDWNCHKKAHKAQNYEVIPHFPLCFFAAIQLSWRDAVCVSAWRRLNYQLPKTRLIATKGQVNKLSG
jgi:hypothetical protein